MSRGHSKKESLFCLTLIVCPSVEQCFFVFPLIGCQYINSLSLAFHWWNTVTKSSFIFGFPLIRGNSEQGVFFLFLFCLPLIIGQGNSNGILYISIYKRSQWFQNWKTIAVSIISRVFGAITRKIVKRMKEYVIPKIKF